MVSMSTDYATWTKNQLARDRTKTQAGLARRLRLNKSAVSRMLSGERKITASELDEIIAYLGVAHPHSTMAGNPSDRGFADPAAEFRGADREHPAPRPCAPIYATTFRSDGQWSLDRGEAIDWRQKAHGHETAVRLFGFYAPDDTMAPRFKRGEIVWVDPGRPAVQGKDALLMRRQEYEKLEHIILCEIVELHNDMIAFRQFSSDDVVRVSTRDWSTNYVLDRV